MNLSLVCIGQICRNPNFWISQKTPIGKEKVTIQGEGTQKLVAHFPYRRRHVDIIYRISRGILKHTKVVGTGLNPKPISGGMRKVVKRVRSGGNLKAISGDMGRVFCKNNSRL